MKKKTGSLSYASLPSKSDGSDDNYSSNNEEEFVNKNVQKPRKRVPLSIATKKRKNQDYDSLLENNGIKKKMKNLSIQTKNILKTKRSRSETNRWEPTNQDFRKILKPLTKKPTSPPVTNKMSKRWSEFYLKNSVSEHQSARFENLLKKMK